MICRRKSRELASRHYRDAEIIEEWVPDILRHSFCSYLLAKSQNIGYVADQAGNSPDIIKKNYRRPIPKVRGVEYFDLRPEENSGDNIVEMVG